MQAQECFWHHRSSSPAICHCHTCCCNNLDGSFLHLNKIISHAFEGQAQHVADAVTASYMLLLVLLDSTTKSLVLLSCRYLRSINWAGVSCKWSLMSINRKLTKIFRVVLLQQLLGDSPLGDSAAPPLSWLPYTIPGCAML